jgi:hypothetical protein
MLAGVGGALAECPINIAGFFPGRKTVSERSLTDFGTDLAQNLTVQH